MARSNSALRKTSLKTPAASSVRDVQGEAVLPTFKPKASHLRVLGINQSTAPSIIKVVNHGLPFAAFERLQQALDLSVQQTAELVSISPTTLARRREQKRFQPAEGERIIRLSRIYTRAVELFDGNRETARRWLNAPQAALGGVSPFLMAKSELGAIEVERLIGRLEHGVFT